MNVMPCFKDEIGLSVIFNSEAQSQQPFCFCSGMLSLRLFSLDKRAFFLVNKSSDAPQVHELVAKSKEEKNRLILDKMLFMLHINS